MSLVDSRIIPAYPAVSIRNSPESFNSLPQLSYSHVDQHDSFDPQRDHSIPHNMGFNMKSEGTAAAFSTFPLGTGHIYNHPSSKDGKTFQHTNSLVPYSHYPNLKSALISISEFTNLSLPISRYSLEVMTIAVMEQGNNDNIDNDQKTPCRSTEILPTLSITDDCDLCGRTDPTRGMGRCCDCKRCICSKCLDICEVIRVH